MADGLTYTTADGLIFVPSDYQIFTYNNRSTNNEEYIVFKKMTSYISAGLINGLILVDNYGRILTNNQRKILIK